MFYFSDVAVEKIKPSNKERREFGYLLVFGSTSLDCRELAVTW